MFLNRSLLNNTVCVVLRCLPLWMRCVQLDVPYCSLYLRVVAVFFVLFGCSSVYSLMKPSKTEQICKPVMPNVYPHHRAWSAGPYACMFGCGVARSHCSNSPNAFSLLIPKKDQTLKLLNSFSRVLLFVVVSSLSFSFSFYLTPCRRYELKQHVAFLIWKAKYEQRKKQASIERNKKTVAFFSNALSPSLSVPFHIRQRCLADATLTKMDATNGKRNIRLNDF